MLALSELWFWRRSWSPNDALPSFALVFGFAGGGLSTWVSAKPPKFRVEAAVLMAGAVWAAAAWVAATLLPVVGYLLAILFGLVLGPIRFVLPNTLASTIRVALFVLAGGGAGLLCGGLAAAASLPVQRMLIRRMA